MHADMLEKYVEYSRLSSLLFWWPRVKDLPVPKPKTVVVELSEEEAKFVLWESGLPRSLEDRLLEAGERLGYPLFLRTDAMSGKHFWARACYVESPSALLRNAAMLVELSEASGVLGLPVRAFVLREFLELDAPFRAFGGLPIARERRYLVVDGRVVAHFPYWPEEAIEFWGYFGVEEPPDWRERLRRINEESDEEVELLSRYAELIGGRLGGFWSVDFARVKDGTWYFIDAARGEVSWMPSEVAEKMRELGLEVLWVRKEE